MAAGIGDDAAAGRATVVEFGVATEEDDDIGAGRAAAVKIGNLESGPAGGDETLATNDVGSATGRASAEAIGEPESEYTGIGKCFGGQGSGRKS